MQKSNFEETQRNEKYFDQFENNVKSLHITSTH